MSVESKTIVLRVKDVCVAALGFVFAVSVAFAQPDADTLETVRACSSIQADRARLACLDSALLADAQRDEAAVSALEADEERARTEAESSAEVEERSIRIVTMRENNFGVTTFVAEDGETWVQRSGSAGRFPPVPFDAILQPGMGDSYFLLSPLGGRRARVQPMR